VEVISSRTLPTGLLWEVEFDVLYKKLYDGDSMILVSDGVLDSISTEKPEQELKEWLPVLYGESPKQAADQIMEYALEKAENTRRDDMSVMVIHVWKKKHGKRK
jgi:stage II sporulation protein E